MIIHDLRNGSTSDRLPDGLNISVALGNFDGVHKGHLHLLSKLPELPGEPAVWYFSNFPAKGPLLTVESDKLELFRKAGIRYAVSEEFDSVCEMTPSEFVENVLISKLNCRSVVCGFNFRFGKNASGDANILKTICNENSAECLICPPFEYEGSVVSSSRIRQALSYGDVTLASRLLGRNYSISSSVLKGDGIGKIMGYPTVNLYPDPSLALPKNGVYASLCMGMPSVTNIGVRPTVSDSGTVSCETHIIGYDDDLYGDTIKIEFVCRLRDEVKFPSLDKLIAQISSDVDTTLKMIGNKDT